MRYPLNKAPFVSRDDILKGETQFYTPQGAFVPNDKYWASIYHQPESQRGRYLVSLYAFNALNKSQDLVARYHTNNLDAARDTCRNWAEVRGDGHIPQPCERCDLQGIMRDNGHVLCVSCALSFRERNK